MLKKIVLYFIHILEKRYNKRILFINKDTFLPNNTATLSKYGFWYTGNVFDMADISYGIAIQGSVEKEETNLVIKILDFLTKTQNVSLYDIGANSGYYGILSAFLYKNKIQVYSFEPLIECTDCIKKSVYLNKLDNLKVFEFGLGNKLEEKIMYLAGSGSSFEKGFTADNIAKQRKIKINKLDDIVFKEKIVLPDFIKIDVEGHEQNVLEGANEAISKSLPVLFIEIAYSMKNIGRTYINNDYLETFDFLKKSGYQSYKIENSTLQKFNPEEKPDGVIMYLFLHKDRHEKLKNYIIHEKFN